MTAESELIKYGYAALALGTFLEGETILVIAGFLANRGYMSFPLVVIVAFAGTFFGDQLYFQIGRHGGGKILKRFPGFAEKAKRVRHLLSRHSTFAIFIFRFLYGLRAVSPFVIGMSHVSQKKFFIVNFISAVVWSAAVAAAGYFLGKGVETFISDIKHRELEIILILAAAGVAFFALFYLRRKRRRRSKEKKD